MIECIVVARVIHRVLSCPNYLETLNTPSAVRGFVARRDIDAPAFEQSFQPGNLLVGAVDPVRHVIKARIVQSFS